MSRKTSRIYCLSHKTFPLHLTARRVIMPISKTTRTAKRSQGPFRAAVIAIQNGRSVRQVLRATPSIYLPATLRDHQVKQQNAASPPLRAERRKKKTILTVLVHVANLGRSFSGEDVHITVFTFCMSILEKRSLLQSATECQALNFCAAF